MRLVIALAAALTGIYANNHVNNLVHVQNGQVVGYGSAHSFKDMPSTRSEGSGDDGNVFNGQIGITDALNPNSPLSQWMDDLLNPESDPYKQAVVDAMKILLTILLMALGGLGINTFSVIILGFAPGSVIVEYEVRLPSDDVLPEVFQDAVHDTIADNSESIDGYSFDNSATSLEVSTDPVVLPQCADCWIPQTNVTCVPDPDLVELNCRPDGMELKLHQCVMGLTSLPALSLNSASCDENNAITMEGDEYVAFTKLDECSTSMNFQENHIEFKNALMGNFDAGSVISTYDRYKVEYQCNYAANYDDITSSTNVTSQIMSGPVEDGEGVFDFQLEFYTDNTFASQDTTGSVKVGTTLFFAVELGDPISGVEFTVTDCTVKNSDMTLGYDILTNKCANNRVNFNIMTNKDSTKTTFSYTVFEFKNDNAATLHLSCNIVVCDSTKDSSTCNTAANCGSRRRRRSFDHDTTYYRVAKEMLSV